MPLIAPSKTKVQPAPEKVSEKNKQAEAVEEAPVEEEVKSKAGKHSVTVADIAIKTFKKSLKKHANITPEGFFRLCDTKYN